MFFTPPKNPTKAPKKNGRSTSPRAVERRRRQNRIAQHNHRLRVRQAGNDGKEKSKLNCGTIEKIEETVQQESVAPSTVDSLGVPQSTPVSSPTSTVVMADEFLPFGSSWDQLDYLTSLTPILSDNASITSQLRSPAESFTTPSCNCNSKTGPCSNHIEILRAQVPVETNMSLAQQVSSLPSPIDPSMVPNGRNTSFSHGVRRSLPFIYEKMSAREPPPPGSNTAGIPKAEMTPLDTVLETMRQVGFQDFEELGVAYYTSDLERDSVPAMLQSASRSRRLKYMLQRLQHSSRNWPRWESRGLHESFSEAALSLCVDELESVCSSTMAAPPQSETAELISSLEWLLRGHGCSLSTSTKTIDGSNLLEQIEAAPESMRHLWSLLTNLTGAQSIYCDRFARIILTIILFARRAE